MKYVNYIARDYVPRVDLTTLGNTYNTLEQGHQEAVKTASDLKTTVAALDMNEAEDGFKQQLVNEINTAIDENTLYGNSYGALDDLIIKAGNITSDPRVISRLRSQQEYKNFQTKVDSMDMPEDYKSIYKEINPYHYEDTIDAITGQVIGGNTWKPTYNPVNTVPLSEIITNGIKIAAEDSGESMGTVWLDKNGRPTNDPNQSFDGEVYMTTASGYKALTKDKIRAGIQAYIESTPGAKASLEQDYKIATYKFQRDGYNPDVTDSNGVLLTPDQYLYKRIDPAVQAASYYNSKNITKYGDGLKTYKAAMTAQATAGSGTTQQNPLDALHLMSRSTPVVVDYDYADNLKGQQQNSYTALVDAYKLATGKDLTDTMKSATSDDWNKLISEINDPQVAASMRRSLRKLNEANYNYNQIANKLTESQQADLDFVTRMSNGAELNSSNNNDKVIINTLNNIFGADGRAAMITTNNEEVFNDILNTINGDNVNGYKSLGIEIGQNSDGKKYFKLPKENYENLVALSNAYNKAIKNIGFFDNITTTTTFNVVDENNKIIPNRDRTNPITMQFIGLGSYFNKVKNKINKDIELVAPTQINISNENLPGKTFTHEKLYQLYVSGAVDNTQYGKHGDTLDEELRNKLIGANYSQINIFGVNTDDGAGSLYRLADSSDRQDIGKEIINAIGTKRMVVNAAHNALYGSGTNITLYSKEDKDGNPIGTPKTYFIPGLITEQAAIDFDNDPATIASDNITIGNETRKTISLSSKYETPTLGAQEIVCLGGNQFVYKNGSTEIPIDRASAVTINQYMEEYLQIKDYYLGGVYNLQDANQVDVLSNSLITIATKIANATGQPENINSIALSLQNDLNK